MEEELCLVDSATTNTILRETKYFQTLTKRKEDVMTITGSNKAIIGSETLVENRAFVLTGSEQ